MLPKIGPRVLLQAAGLFVLSSGIALAQTGVNRGVDDESVPDLPPGFVQSPEAAITDTGVRPGAEAGTVTGETAIRVTDPSDLVGRQPAIDTEATPDVVPGMVTQRQTAAAPLVHQPYSTWELSEWQGRTIQGETGAPIGTVETLAYDRSDRLYVVADLSQLEPAAGRRAIPMTRLGYDQATGALLLDTAGEASLAAIPEYDSESNGYSEFGSDLQYREHTGMFGDPL